MSAADPHDGQYPAVHQQASTGYWLATCPDHHLTRVVETLQHALNIHALHVRLDHAEDQLGEGDTPPSDVTRVDLAAAAGMVVASQEVSGTAGRAALDVWALLTGLDDTEALAYARTITDARTSLHAHVAPF